MAYILDDLTKALNAFESSVKKDLEEIRKSKDEVQRLKEEINHTVSGIHYVRDDGCLILSAPKVIIGNVDHDGTLLPGGGTVTLRGHQVSLEATGPAPMGGSILSRAASIRSLAVDPGNDGQENVVMDASQITQQARSIALYTSESKGAFVHDTISAGTGIELFSDTRIGISAMASNKARSAEIDQRVKILELDAKDLENQAKSLRKTVDSQLKKIKDLILSQEDLNDTEELLRSNQPELSDLQDQFDALETNLYESISVYIRLLSHQAEANRAAAALKEEKKALSSKSSDFAKKTTGSNIQVQTETMGITSVDADGNIRENPEAGLFLTMPHVSLNSHDKAGSLIKDSALKINTEKVDISTATSKLDEKGEKGDITAIGDVTITTKSLTVQAVDNELKDKKIQEKALTKDGTINLRAEKMSLQSTDTEGKSTGSITLNAKSLQAASMDVDKEKRTEKQLAQGSQMVLLTEKMFVGSKDKKNKSKLVQVSSDQVGIMAQKTAEMQQGEGKAVVTLEGGNLTAGSGKNSLKGDTTIEGKADIKGDVTAPKGTFKNLEASSSFKSKDISDGIAVPAASSPGKPSAKMKEEEVKAKE